MFSVENPCSRLGVQMANESSRRDFLKLSATGTAALAGAVVLPRLVSASATDPVGDVSVWVTDDNLRLKRVPSAAWKSAPAGSTPDTVTLDPTKKFQDVLGFGGAFTDAACFTFNRLDPAAREKVFHELFHPSEMGLSVCRTCIGASDYSATVYSFDEGDPDPDLKRFSIEHDRAYILPMLREARKANPDLFLFSSPWSPPGWMKSNGSMLGGSMRRKYMPAYANYFVRFLQGYEAEGVPVQAVTVQNEVDTDQDGRMPACIWPMEYEADFVRTQLGPAFERNGIKTKIWLIDHNYNLWGRAMGELETPDVLRYSNAIAWHGYLGKPEWMDRVHAAYPNVEMYWTEGGPDYTDPNYAKDWSKWSSTFTGVLRNWCRSITAWNLALDETGHPNIGPFPCGGVLTIDSKSREISYSGQYWAFAHYSRFIRRGARRIDSQSPATDLDHVALENPDGKRVLVLTNTGPTRDCQVRLSDKAASISLSPNSVTTLEW
jgi:glucosylceramidase